jgi:hypothetical protein
MANPEKAPLPGEDTALHLETGSFILRSLIRDIALSADGDNQNIRITCVEVWSQYIISINSSFCDFGTVKL